MTYILELVTAFLGCCSAMLGCLCVWRSGEANQCSPEVERLAWRLMIGGATGVVIATLATALIG